MTDSNADRGRLLQSAISAVRARRLSEGRALLQQVLAAEPNNETAWLWLAAAVETPGERLAALTRVLQINPANQSARRALDRLRAEAERATPPVPVPPPATNISPAPPSASPPTPPDKASVPPRQLSVPDVPLPPITLPPREPPGGLDLGFLDVPGLPARPVAFSTEPAAPSRRPPIGLIMLLIGTVVVVIAIVAIFFRNTGTPPVLPTGGGVAGSTSDANVPFIALQQTHDAQTLTPNSAPGTVITPVSQLLPPSWTVQPSNTLPPSATFPASPTSATNTASPTFATATPLASLRPFATPTITTTPPDRASLIVGFAQASKAHAAIRTLMQIRVGGTTPIALTGEAASATDLAWSPDGSQLAYITPVNGIPQLAIAMADGSQPQVLTTLAGAYLRSPRWSPDGKQIVYAGSQAGSRTGAQQGAQNDTTGLYLLQLSDRTIRPLTEAQANSTSIIHDPSWSPDGTQIVYAASVSRADVFQIEVLTLAGGQIKALTNSTLDAVEPAWSPDGTQIAFSAIAQQSGTAALMLMNADGSGARSLTTDQLEADHRRPAWSPDGHWLAFSANRDGGFAVYVGLVTPLGLAEVTRLTDPAQASDSPAFRPAVVGSPSPLSSPPPVLSAQPSAAATPTETRF